MKNAKLKTLRRFYRKLLGSALLGVALVMFLFALLASARAQTLGSSGFGTRWEQILTNQVVVATTNTNSLSIGVPHPLFKGRGIALFVQHSSTNAATSGGDQYNIDLTWDGVNWTSTNGGVQFTLLMNGTNTYYTNLIADRFDNAKQWRLSQILPSTNSSTNSVFAAVNP